MGWDFESALNHAVAAWASRGVPVLFQDFYPKVCRSWDCRLTLGGFWMQSLWLRLVGSPISYASDPQILAARIRFEWRRGNLVDVLSAPLLRGRITSEVSESDEAPAIVRDELI